MQLEAECNLNPGLLGSRELFRAKGGRLAPRVNPRVHARSKISVLPVPEGAKTEAVEL